MLFDFIKRLFSPSKPLKVAATPPRPKEIRSATATATSPTTPVRQPEVLETDRFSLATSFNDFLLEANEQDSSAPNESERFVIQGLENLLHGKIPSSAVPRLPDVAMALLKELANPEVTQVTIMSYINRDPALASEVLRMSNSSLFKESGREAIINLNDALVLLGLNNLKTIVSSVLMKRLMQIAPIYFRMFGQQLWQHSLDCAHACQELAKFYANADPNNAYLVGLMHDIGKLAIFSLLTKALAQHLDTQPRGAVFSAIVRDHSHKLSAKIAREWALPDFLVLALEEQDHTSSAVEDFSVYGFILSQANTLAEFKAIAENPSQSSKTFSELLAEYSIPVQLFNQVFPEVAAQLMYQTHADPIQSIKN